MKFQMLKYSWGLVRRISGSVPRSTVNKPSRLLGEVMIHASIHPEELVSYRYSSWNEGQSSSTGGVPEPHQASRLSGRSHTKLLLGSCCSSCGGEDVKSDSDRNSFLDSDHRFLASDT